MLQQFKQNSNKIILLALSFLIFIVLQFDLLNNFQIEGQTLVEKLQVFITYFLSVVIEAFPFVVIGVIVSVLVALFFKEEWVFKRLPKNRIFSHLYISFLGMFMPVCECGNVPVTRRLMLKGFNLSQSVTFLLAAPIINPITLLTTWKAFEPDPNFVIFRFLGALFIANFVGILISFKKDQTEFMTEEFEEMCEHDHDHHEKNKISEATEIFRTEFIEVMKMLVFGALIAAFVRTLIPEEIIKAIGTNLFFSVIAMIVFAFILSICSTVDAFVILPLAPEFSFGSILSFLIFGPMIDMKILSMLKTTFKNNLLIIMTFFVTILSILIGLLLNLII